MKFDMVNSVVGDDDQERSEFRVGNYTLQLNRSCDKTRKHLRLSNREFELLMWIGAGLKKREIAGRMGVTPATADTFRRRAYAKLGVSSGSAAVAIISAHLAGTEVEATLA
jgi:DNA-binding CsgD family transcriptional regulator